MQIFNDMKIQSNLAHLETHIRLVVELADVRILAFGVLNKPRGTFTVNDNARAFLHPPGIERTDPRFSSDQATIATMVVDPVSQRSSMVSISPRHDGSMQSQTEPRPTPLGIYEFMTQPLPTLAHEDYPFYTPYGHDKRWLGTGPLEESGRQWVGALMLTAQITGPHSRDHYTDGPPFQDLDLTTGPGRGQYASLTWADLDAIAPWMSEYITKRIDGPGLGH